MREYGGEGEDRGYSGSELRVRVGDEGEVRQT